VEAMPLYKNGKIADRTNVRESKGDPSAYVEKQKEETLRMTKGLWVRVPEPLPQRARDAVKDKVPCALCGKHFIKTHPKNKYCSDLCRYTAIRERQRMKRDVERDTELPRPDDYISVPIRDIP
jgi:predicted nucleic acid-binding Zn ribbon protein